MQLISLFGSWGYQIKYYSTAGESDFREEISEDYFEYVITEMNSDSFDEQIKSYSPDIVIFDRFMVEEQFAWRVVENCPEALRIIETIDIHCLRDARQKQPESIETYIQKSEMAHRELASILRSDLSLIISTEEMKLLHSKLDIPLEKLFYLPFEYYSKGDTSDKLSFQERTDFIAIGNFKHPPNREAVRCLKKEIFPRIRKVLPKAKLHIYGSYPEEKDFQLQNTKEGFFVHGRAESALEVVGKARVSLAPLSFGAGIKGKLIESMVCDTPSVTTSIGAEGMNDEGKWNGFVCDDYDEFAQKAVLLHENEREWHKANEKGHAILKKIFAANKQSLALKDWINSYHRRNQGSLLDQVLTYHSFRAAKYFSRWIQEKNKV